MNFNQANLGFALTSSKNDKNRNRKHILANQAITLQNKFRKNITNITDEHKLNKTLQEIADRIQRDLNTGNLDKNIIEITYTSKITSLLNDVHNNKKDVTNYINCLIAASKHTTTSTTKCNYFGFTNYTDTMKKIIDNKQFTIFKDDNIEFKGTNQSKDSEFIKPLNKILVKTKAPTQDFIKTPKFFEHIATPKMIKPQVCVNDVNSKTLTVLGDADGSGARIIHLLMTNNLLKLTGAQNWQLQELMNAENEVIESINKSETETTLELIKFQKKLNLQEIFDDLVDTLEINESCKDIVLLGDIRFDRFSLNIPAMDRLLKKIYQKGATIILGNHDTFKERKAFSLKTLNEKSAFGIFADITDLNDDSEKIALEVFVPAVFKGNTLLSHHGVYLEQNIIHTAFGKIIITNEVYAMNKENKLKWFKEQLDTTYSNFLKNPHNNFSIFGKELRDNRKSVHLQKMQKFNEFFEVNQLHGHEGIFTDNDNETKIINSEYRTYFANSRTGDGSTIFPFAGIYHYKADE